MRPTSRFGLAAGIVAGGMGMAWLSGPRALNAIVVPIVVLVLLGVFIVGRTGEPSVDRQTVDPGFVGERRSVRATVSIDGPAGASVTDTVSEGLEPLEAAQGQSTGTGPSSTRCA
ncbi:MAG: hypothetical protein U5K37_13245 [Natrialbaceae archaeon]|nr:hypothetical protein [Natrialbaceae archaeon]